MLRMKGYIPNDVSISATDMINYNFGESRFLKSSFNVEKLKNLIIYLGKMKEQWESLQAVTDVNEWLFNTNKIDELKEAFPEFFASNSFDVLKKLKDRGIDNLILQINVLIDNLDKIIYDSKGCYLISNSDLECMIEPLQVNLGELSFLDKCFSSFRPGNKAMTYFGGVNECYIQNLNYNGLGSELLSEHISYRDGSCAVNYYDSEAVSYLKKNNALPSLKQICVMDNDIVPDVSINCISNQYVGAPIEVSINKGGILYSTELYPSSEQEKGYNPIVGHPYSLIQQKIREENLLQDLCNNHTK